jgi:beta-N-acetylhexosaminidase
MEGRAVGVNWTFSPVVDIDYNFRNPITNVRTFGSDPERVLRNASIYVETVQKYGVAAACKHFPGDGVDFRDQHLHPTYNSLSAEEWYATYGKIYQTLIEGGLMSVMVGHIVQPNVIRAVNPAATEAELLPGSLSKELLTGVLRQQFGFNGVIITDATIMGGYTMAMERRQAIPTSIMAGCDMLCFGTDIREDISYLKEALQDGRLTHQRLEEAVTRVLALKAKLARPYPLPEQDGAAEQRKCADKAITLVKDVQKLVPVRAEQYPNIRLVTLGQDETYDGSMTDIAAAFLEARGFTVERYDPFADDLHGTKGLPHDRLTLLLCNLPAASNQTTVRIRWCPKHALEIPRFVQEERVAFLSFANPYHLQDVPRVPTYINAYTATRATIQAALGKLLGEGAFTGVSPVDPFCGLWDAKL